MKREPQPTRKRSPATDNRMASGCFLALLRGINVGGRNLIKMTELRACFEDIGFADVFTYIQSGNVVFRSHEKDAIKLMGRIESALSVRFDYASRVVVRSHAVLERIIERAPAGFGKSPDKYKYDVIFLREPLTAADAMKSVRVKEGVDTAHSGMGVLYCSRLAEKLSQSRLSKIVTLPVYQSMTIRNWNTTTSLLALMEKSFPVEKP